MPQRVPLAGVRHPPRGLEHADILDRRDNVRPLRDRLADALKMMVLREIRPVRIQHQRVTVVPVHLGKRPVDGDGLAALLDRRFPLLDLHRHVPVDDQPVLGIHLEIFQDAAAKTLLVDELEIRILRLLVRRLVGDEVHLERRDLVFSEQRRERPAP